MGKIVGIDFGTSNSSISTIERGKPVLIANQKGSYSTPSVVSFLSNGEYLVGEAALDRYYSYPLSTIRDVKKLLGKKYSEINPYEFSYFIERDENDGILVKVEDKTFYPQQIVAIILKELVTDAEIYLGSPINEIVLTFPVKFTEYQRAALLEATQIANITCRATLLESTAASVYNSYSKNRNDNITLFFDLGGGSLDISVAQIHNIDGDVLTEELATEGDFDLGGRDFNKTISSYITTYLRNVEGMDFSNDLIVQYRLEQIAENLKINLGNAGEVVIVEIPFVAYKGVIKNIKLRFTKKEIESVISDLVSKAIYYMDEVIKNAKLKKEDIKEVVLIGSATQMPYLQNAIEKYFSREVIRNKEADYAVALGGAIRAGVLEGNIKDFQLLDTIPYHIDLIINGKTTFQIISRNTTIPHKIGKKIKIKIKAGSNNGINASVLLVGHWGNFLKEKFELYAGMIYFTGEIEFIIDVAANRNIRFSINDSLKNEVLGKLIAPKENLTRLEINSLKETYAKYQSKRKDEYFISKTTTDAEKVIKYTENQLDIYNRRLDKLVKEELLSHLSVIKMNLKNKCYDLLPKNIDYLNHKWSLLAYELYSKNNITEENTKVEFGNTIKKAVELIAKSRLKESLELLMCEFDTNKHSELLLLSFKINKVNDLYHLKGVISYENYQLEQNQLLYATLDYINKMQKEYA